MWIVYINGPNEIIWKYLVKLDKFYVKVKCVPKMVKVQCIRQKVNENQSSSWGNMNENRGTILERKYDKLTDSEQVLWKKDERETYKGVKWFEIQEVEIT